MSRRIEPEHPLFAISPEIKSRYQFAKLCNARQARIAVEVGTDQGLFAKRFMEDFAGEHLFCIDDYRPHDFGEGPRTSDLVIASVNLAPWAGRARIIQQSSEKAAKQVPWWAVPRIDFVYIDGDHSRVEVENDIRRWWPILSTQGILAGHDYDQTHPGVVAAVKCFAEEHNLQVLIVEENDDPLKSWYIYKNPFNHRRLQCIPE